MKVWIDVLTPKQALFLGPLATRLEKTGHEIILTTRRYREVNQMLEMKGYKAEIVGEHGGASLFRKLRASTLRIALLARLVEKTKPSLAVSFSSPEASRVAYGLSIPHYCVSDSPHAIAVSRLSVPFSKRLFTPWVIPRNAWRKFGISSSDIITYRALDPVVWVRGIRPSRRILEELNLDENKPIVTIRPEEKHAAYLLGVNRAERSVTENVVRDLLGMNEDLQIVIVGRYGRESTRKWHKFGTRVKVSESIIDGPSLVAHSSLFVGAGGTMTAEAALLGTPAISIYPGEPTIVEKFLIRVGLVYRSLDSRRLANACTKMMYDEYFLKKYRRTSHRLLKNMEDPIAIIVKHLTESEE